MVTTAYDELLETGMLGPQGVAMLYRTVAAVARFDRYPSPESHATWTTEAVTEVAHDFIVGPRSTERLAHLAALASDEMSFARLLEATVRNFFRSRARATDRGKLHRRVRSVLEGDDAFVQVGPGQPGAGWWHLAGGSDTPFAGRVDELLAAASAVAVALVRWRESTKADQASLLELCVSVLATADGAVALDDVVGVIAHRLGVGPPPVAAEVEAPDPDASADVAGGVLAGFAATGVFDQLTPRERLLLLVLDEPVREAAAFVGVSKTTAADGMQRLRTKLKTLLPDATDRAGVLRELLVFSAAWSGERTDDDNMAY